MRKIIASIAALLVITVLALSIASYAASVTYSGVTLSTDKDKYLPGETVTITVSFEKPFTGSVYLYVYKPGGVLDFYKYASLTNETTYTVTYKPQELGVYTVKASIQGSFAGENRTIVIPASALSVTFTVATQYAIKGKVVDENGNPVPGATVVVKEAGLKATTDENGYFVVSVAKPGTYTLYAEKNGYLPSKPVEVSVSQMGITELEKPLVIESFTHAILRLQNDIQQLSNKLTELNTTLSNAIVTQVNSLRTELTNSLNQLSSDVNKKIGALSQRVTGLENTIAGINDAIKQLSNSVTGLKDNIQSLQTSLQNLQAQLSNVQKQLQGKADKAALQQLTTTLNNLNTKINSMDKTLSTLQSTVTQLQGVVNDLKATVEGLKTTVSSLQTSVSDLKSAMNNVQNKLNTVASQANSAAQQASKATKKADDAASKAMLGIVIGIIGLIIAIIAVILVYRKIAV